MYSCVQDENNEASGLERPLFRGPETLLKYINFSFPPTFDVETVNTVHYNFCELGDPKQFPESFPNSPLNPKLTKNKSSDVAGLDLLTHVLVSAGTNIVDVTWNLLLVDTMPIFGVRIENYTGRMDIRQMNIIY